MAFIDELAAREQWRAAYHLGEARPGTTSVGVALRLAELALLTAQTPDEPADRVCRVLQQAVTSVSTATQACTRDDDRAALERTHAELSAQLVVYASLTPARETTSLS